MIHRFYLEMIKDHLLKYNQMVFLSGPRQVGKTTISKYIAEESEHSLYLNWDFLDDRELILSGPKNVAKKLHLDVSFSQKPIIVFDEIHKYTEWKNYIKGFYDAYKDKVSILVTGSARLDVYKRGGDSLMGRYFHYRAHPLSVSEICHPHRDLSKQILQATPISKKDWDDLMKFGGFPDPFLNRDELFYTKWKMFRHTQLFQEDIRDLSRVVEIAQMEVLSKIISANAGQLLSYTSLSKKVRVTDKTIRNWLEILSSLYYCFLIRPWSKNIVRSLIKEPKIYLWDWSLVSDRGQHIENFVACHLLKAVHFWKDSGFDDYDLHFIRDKEKREVDFVISKNNEVWALIEVKKSYKEPISKSLMHFHHHLNPEHTFQVACDLGYQDVDVFKLRKPSIVSMKTFLSQLI